jgi:hypothetical protein
VLRGGEAADVQHFLLAAVKAIEHQDGYCRYPPMSLIAYMAPYSNSPPKSRPTQKYWTALISATLTQLFERDLDLILGGVRLEGEPDGVKNHD